MRKTAFALTLVIIAVLSCLFAIESKNAVMVSGNPIIHAAPGKYDEPPLIFLFSPMNKSYTENVSMSFIISAPTEGWSVSFGPVSDPVYAVSELLSVDYYIDGSFKGSIVANSNLYPSFEYSAPLLYLQDGNHTLMVKTNSVGFELSSDGRISKVTGRSASQTVEFNVEKESSFNSFQTVFSTVLVIVAVIVAIGLFVYIRKRK